MKAIFIHINIFPSLPTECVSFLQASGQLSLCRNVSLPDGSYCSFLINLPLVLNPLKLYSICMTSDQSQSIPLDRQLQKERNCPLAHQCLLAQSLGYGRDSEAGAAGYVWYLKKMLTESELIPINHIKQILLWETYYFILEIKLKAKNFQAFKLFKIQVFHYSNVTGELDSVIWH